MTDYKIDFETLEWECPSAGLRVKKQLRQDRSVRLLEFSTGFKHPEWCTKGHTAIVLEGALKIEFDDHSEVYGAGAAFHIPEGEAHRHRPTVVAGKTALVFITEAA